MQQNQPEQTPQENSQPTSPALKRAAQAGAIALSLLSFQSGASATDPGALLTPPARTADIDLGQARIKAPAREPVAIPEGVSRIGLSTEAEKWIKMQKDVALNSTLGEGKPRLIDGTRFLTKETADKLTKFDGLHDDSTGLSFKKKEENGYKFVVTTRSGDVWYVAECPYYRDQFPYGIPFSQGALEIYKKGSDSLTQKEFKAPDVFKNASGQQGSQYIDFAALQRIITAAEANRASEVLDVIKVRDLKLSDQVTGYVALIDYNRSDPIMNGMIDDGKYFPQMMNSLKGEDQLPLYNLVSRNGSDFVKVDREPKQLLTEHVQGMYDQGVRRFYLNLCGHGNESGVWFNVGFRALPLTPAGLHSIFSKFQDCEFVVDTLACYGGGMAEEMKSYRDPTGKEGRILIKLQAKPYSYNQEGRLVDEPGVRGEPKAYSSYYQVYNTFYLLEGKNFGEAHYLADLAAKKLIPCDAEAWSSGPSGGRTTAKFKE